MPHLLPRLVRPALLLSLFVSALSPAASLAAEDPALDPTVPVFPMPLLKAPAFGPGVFDIRDHGAREGGVQLNTQAIADTIAACAAAGGGRVLVPSGRWLTGPIHLRSGVELHLAEGSELVFSDRFEDYLPVQLVRSGGVELYNYSPLIYARDCSNVGITGKGRLNGNARAWWAWVKKETKQIPRLQPEGVPVERRRFGSVEAGIRPSFVVFLNCRNVVWEDFTIGSGPNWTLHPIYCENLIVRRVNVDTDGPNNDGLDPDSCRNVLIEDCVFSTGDDCVVLKSGYNEDGWRVGRPTENVVMRRCLARRGHGGLVIGSEMSGGVRNVYLKDCVFEGTDRALRIKSRRDRGGIVEGVWVDGIRAKDMKREVILLTMDYGADPNLPVSEHAPVFRNIHVRNVEAQSAPIAVLLEGLASSPVQDFTLDHARISSRRGLLLRSGRELAFSDVVLDLQDRTAIELEDVKGIRFRDFSGPAGKSFRLHCRGDGNSDLRLETGARIEAPAGR